MLRCVTRATAGDNLRVWKKSARRSFSRGGPLRLLPRREWDERLGAKRAGDGGGSEFAGDSDDRGCRETQGVATSDAAKDERYLIASALHLSSASTIVRCNLPTCKNIVLKEVSCLTHLFACMRPRNTHTLVSYGKRGRQLVQLNWKRAKQIVADGVVDAASSGRHWSVSVPMLKDDLTDG